MIPLQAVAVLLIAIAVAASGLDLRNALRQPRWDGRRAALETERASRDDVGYGDLLARARVALGRELRADQLAAIVREEHALTALQPVKE